MVKRGKRISKPKNHAVVMKKQDEFKSRAAKRIFFIFLDVVILVAFSLAIYFTLVMDYTKVILFLVMGSLLLLFFIIRKLVRRR
ncbi:MAG: hypothetical protein M1416_03340 [Candidatus Pacearchaeota archaeon]|nr:hypothetical protein [Candidatus Pacearchaeota archaeon]